MYVINYISHEWPHDKYEIIDNYSDPFYGYILVIINKKTYESYSHAKSARK